MLLNIAIADDESVYADTLEGYIKNYAEENDEMFKIFKFKNGIDLLSANRCFDIVFLDIDMPLMDGMTAAKRMRERKDSSVIIFITNLAQMAINGYEVEALDFIVKPVNDRSFAYKFKKALSVAKNRKKDEIIINVKSGKIRLLVPNIKYVEVRGHRIIWHTVLGEFESWNTLASVWDELKDKGFAYCNGSQIVNLDYVIQIDGNDIRVGDKSDSDVLGISRLKKKEFIKQVTVHCFRG